MTDWINTGIDLVLMNHKFVAILPDMNTILVSVLPNAAHSISQYCLGES